MGDEFVWMESPFYKGLSEQQIQHLFDHTCRRMRKYLPEVAEDIAMDAMIKATRLRFEERGDPVESRKGFLFVAAWRLASDYIRARPTYTLHRDRGQIVSIKQEMSTGDDLTSGVSINDLLTEHPTAQAQISHEESRRILEQSVSFIRPILRSSIVQLHYLEEKDYLQIARELNIPLGTVCTGMMKGLESLRGILAFQGYDVAQLLPIETPATRSKYRAA